VKRWQILVASEHEDVVKQIPSISIEPGVEVKVTIADV
jgi:hypothetical protein